MICKVQISLSVQGHRVLVYNEDKSFVYEQALDALFSQLMHEPPNGLRPKAFFYVEVTGEGLEIGEAAPWQSW